MCNLEEKEGCGPAASFVPTLDAPFSATQRASTGVKSSCVVEQRPKWRRDESQRCRLLACVACVVIALCLVPTVSVTIFYKLSRDSANGTQQEKASRSIGAERESEQTGFESSVTTVPVTTTGETVSLRSPYCNSVHGHCFLNYKHSLPLSVWCPAICCNYQLICRPTFEDAVSLTTACLGHVRI